MAAPMEKLAKADRRVVKKANKARHMLLRHGITSLSDQPTNKLVVANAGLGNNVEREEVFEIFCSFGTLCDVIMLPRKPYAFVVFMKTEDAISAREELHGSMLKCPQQLSLPNVTFYIYFTNSVPESEIPVCELPPGLILKENFLSEEEEAKLLGCLDWTADGSDTGAGQSLKHRRVKHFGYEFKYGINNVDKESPLEEGIPVECEDILTRLGLLDSSWGTQDQLTVNQYQPGQGIPPHIDTHSAFEDGIISVCLGSQVVMDFRHPDGHHVPVLLPRRSVVIMTGESRYLWSHGITPRKSDIIPQSQAGEDAACAQCPGLTQLKRGTRTSFTFRRILRKPCSCAYPEQCDSQVGIKNASKMDTPKGEQKVLSASEAERLEVDHVHKVYEDIASHFSATRHSPWPKVAEFLNSLTPGSVVVDIGCGNGKYLGLNKHLVMFGSDRSQNLCEICVDRGHEVFISDILSVPLRDDSLDAAICIAVIHHLSTQERRQRAVSELIRVLRPGGQLLITVWAYEQELKKKKSNYLKDSKMKMKTENIVNNSGYTKEDYKSVDVNSARVENVEDDVGQPMQEVNNTQTATCEETVGKNAPINTMTSVSEKDSKLSEETSDKSSICDKKNSEQSKCSNTDKTKTITDGGSQIKLESSAGGMRTGPSPSEGGSSDQTAWSHVFSVHVNRTSFEHQDVLVPWHLRGGKAKSTENSGDSVHHRFYHVFHQGELESLCNSVSSVNVKNVFYDQGNWCIVVEKS